ncbi:hypothetical protein DAEQUDRAFT_667465, partial [Daedalea quercina L-15889]
LALLLYEYVITLGQECRFIWTNGRMGYAAIFLINRLNMLGLALSLIVNVFASGTFMVCHQSIVSIFWNMITLSTQIVWAGTSTLRVYAISNRNILLAFLTAALAVIPVGVNVVSSESQ